MPIDAPACRLLLIEDDDDLAGEIADEFRNRGETVDIAPRGDVGLTRARDETFDLLILDRMLPGLDGLSLLARLRAAAMTTPVLVLSAMGAVDDRVTGLKAGGDDYLAKPFAMEELVARVEALLRRPAEIPATAIRVGPLHLDLIERTAKRGVRPLDLLPREFRLLEYMVRRPDRVLTRQMLLEDVWHYRFVPQTNLVDVHIGRLRRKVDAPGEPPLIHSVRGAGFALRVPD